MLEAILAQFGITPDQIEAFKKQALNAGRKIEGFDAKLDVQAATLARIEAMLGASDEVIARVAHEVNRAYCLSIGDSSQPTWADAPEWQKKSAVVGVKFLRRHPDATPADTHAAWLKGKEADGWTHGAVKDADKKTHPCLLPYEELPAEHRTKDYLFGAVVRALI